MKAIISSTKDDRYFYFIPIVTYLWKKLGVEVVCFVPLLKFPSDIDTKPNDIQKVQLIQHYTKGSGMQFHSFKCPDYKEATYAQCSRLYGACLDLPEDEILIVGDVDMAIFKLLHYIEDASGNDSHFTIYGGDLVPEGQYPMCYLLAPVKTWRDKFDLKGKTYQQCLDNLLGDIECESFRGNYWGKDQETAFQKIGKDRMDIKRSNGQNQFAQNRVDRDDINWRSYVNDRLIDAHLWRPGYTDEAHANIMELMKMKFPSEDFTWLDNYRNAYKQLL